MAIQEREGVYGAESPWREGALPWDEWPVLELAPGGPPDEPPTFSWDDGGDGDGDDEVYGTWGRRILAAVGIVVLLCMVVSPIAADLLAGHGATRGGVITSSGDR